MIEKYAILVNKEKPISENFYKNFQLVETTDVENKTIKIEKITFDNYIKLKNYLSKNKNLKIGILNSFRDFEEQKKICEEYEKIYGTEKAHKLAAIPGTSEHHTGLAIDITVKKDNGKYALTNEELYEEENKFAIIHQYLYLFGFILRYPKDKTEITKYNYEPWHIRYIGKELAQKCYNENITLEEYYL